jgi:hypothetical protein
VKYISEMNLIKFHMRLANITSITICELHSPKFNYMRIDRGMGVRVTKITGSGSDDWIYGHFGYKFS